MFRTLMHVLRNLRARPSRTFLTTFGIVLGVAVILAISITNLSTLDSITTLFSESSGKANLAITSATSSEQGFRDDAVYRASAVPGVQYAVPSLHVQALLADDVRPSQVEVSMFGAVAGGMQIYGIDPVLDRQAREYKIVAGQFLSDDLDPYDIVLVKDYAEQKHIQVGKDILMLTPQGYEKLRVVGLMSKEGPGNLNNGAFGVMPLRAAQKIFNRSGSLDQIDIVATPQAANGAELDALKASLQNKLGREYSVIYPATQGKRVTQMLNTYQIGLSFFSVIALFVGAFLIYNAFSMTVVERTREIGMLRTIGMTQTQVMQQILMEAGILGFIGAGLGVGAGILLSQGLIRGSELLVGQAVREVHVPADGLMISILVGIGVTLVAALIPAWQAGRISPLEALRIRGNTREGWLVTRGWTLGIVLLIFSYIFLYYPIFPLSIQYKIGNAAVFTLFVGATLLIPATIGPWERITRPWINRIYGGEGQLGARNTQRAKMRTMLTVAALMVGVAMILGIRSMTDAFEHDIRAWIEVYIGGDLFVHSNLPLRADLEPRLEAIEGVAAVTPMRYFDVKRLKPGGGDENVAFMAFDPASYRRVTSFVFTANQGNPDQLIDRLAAGDAVFISSVMSERTGLKQGDTIRLETRRGAHDFEIVAVVVDFYNQGIVIEGSWKDMRRYFGIDNVSMFLLKVDPEENVDQVSKRIDEQYGKTRHLTIESNKSLKARALGLTAQAFSLFDVLAMIAMIVAALGVVNTMTMSVLERTREIGMLRSLGMTRWQVGKMILAEAAIIGLIGGAFGLAFGLFLSRVFLIATTVLQGYDLTYVLPTQGIVVSLVIALVVSQIAALWPARRAVSIQIIETIHYE